MAARALESGAARNLENGSPRALEDGIAAGIGPDTATIRVVGGTSTVSASGGVTIASASAIVRVTGGTSTVAASGGVSIVAASAIVRVVGVAGTITGGDVLTLATRTVRIRYRHRTKVVIMASSYVSLSIPNVQHFAGDTTPIGLIVLDDDAYLEAAGLSWAASAEQALTRASATPWDSVSITGDTGSATVPSITMSFVGLIAGLWVLTLVGTAAGIRKVVKVQLDVVA